MRRALLLVPLILACGGLDAPGTGDGGLPSDEAPSPPPAASLSLDKSTVNLGALDVNGAGVATVTLTNTGNAASGAVMITARDGVTATGCSGPLAAGASCTISITATPTVAGSFSGSVSISADPGAVTPLLISIITYEGCVPLFVSPPAIDLGPIPLGFLVPPTKITLSTTCGLTDLTLAASGPDVAIDQDDTTCTAVLAPEASCVVVVDFLAATFGDKSDAVTISAGGPAGKKVTVAITANVVTGVFLVIDPSTPAGASALFGQASSPFTFTVGNQGDTPTGTLSVAVTGPNAADFVATSTCTVLASLGTCTVSVVFQPTASGATRETATLTVADIGARVSIVDVSLIGMVVPPLP